MGILALGFLDHSFREEWTRDDLLDDRAQSVVRGLGFGKDRFDLIAIDESRGAPGGVG
jgi:hypothetical protein